MLYRILFFLLLSISGYCQNTIGLPDIINYHKDAYNAGLQNWQIKQDKNGIIYVANNEGLLSFDGKYWKMYPLPNKTIVRSLEISSDNKIYVGGQDELGYFTPSNNGKLQYTSLINLIDKENRSFGDVWSIVTYKNEVFFRASNKILQLTNNKSIKSYNSTSGWTYIGVCNNQLYVQEHKNGLLKYENNAWLPFKLAEKVPNDDFITSMLYLKADSIIITTLKNGIYLYTNNTINKIITLNLSSIEKDRIYSATVINNEWMALATNNGGVYIIDTKGTIIQKFSKAEGLQNNNVRSIFLDKESNLWLGLDNGIDFVAYNSAIKRINPSMQDGSGYAAIIHNNYLYAGTPEGLYNVTLQPTKDLSFSIGTFTPVSNTRGQVWSLNEINGKVLVGHHEGAFVIQGNTAQTITSNTGYWNFLPLSNTNSTNTLIAGNYKGLRFFNYNNQNFTEGQSIPDFNETSRFVNIDKFNNIWVSHPYHGVYKLSINTNGIYKTQIYTNNNGLPSTLNNHIYKIKNEILVATEKGIFIYDYAKDIFEPSEFYKKILGEQSIRYLKEDTEGNIWFIHEKSIGVIDLSSQTPVITHFPELNNKLLSGFEFIYPVNNNNIFVGGEKGFFHINYEKFKKNVPELKVQLRTVRIIDQKDSLIFGGYFAGINETQVQQENTEPRISNHWKTIHFEFSSPLFGQQPNLEFSYRLKGFDNNWSTWSGKTEKEYTNLPEGKYVFEVKVRNNLGNESAKAAYTFKVLPPWYQTIWAKIIYTLLFIAVITILYNRQKKKFKLQEQKHDEEQKRLLYILELERTKAESELVTLRNEKLEADINFKNSELASSAMHLVKKGELLGKVKSDLAHLMKGLENTNATGELKKMIKAVSEDDNIDKEWESFTKHFDKVHSDFLIALKEKHPTVSPNELKLCAYLRMNLSTKEIAQLMNISVRGVEISRYRLRKKLNISSETNLFDYLINIQAKA
jgi:ligand-binding sensor domain-containing protein/DNA-binding CsgD family transcriptional regulator